MYKNIVGLKKLKKIIEKIKIKNKQKKKKKKTRKKKEQRKTPQTCKSSM